MTIAARRTTSFTPFACPGISRRLAAAALLAALAAAPGAAGARETAVSYDGTWNVTFYTQAGNCSPTNSAPFAVTGGRVSSAGGGKVTGGIGRGGAVSVRISLGLSVANGSGRLAGNSGSGRWTGVISGERCSGSWQATRG